VNLPDSIDATRHACQQHIHFIGAIVGSAFGGARTLELDEAGDQSETIGSPAICFLRAIKTLSLRRTHDPTAFYAQESDWPHR
jgi:hypothetical protein